MESALRVLILEDRPADAELLVHELQRAGYAPVWQRVETERDYLDQLAAAPDLILADYALPRFDALSALHRLQELGLDIPFIVVTGAVSEDAAVACMQQGAADYLLKDRLSRLGGAVGRALDKHRLRMQQRQTEAALRESEEYFRAIFEQAAVGISTVALDGRWLRANDRLCAITGYSREELLARTYQDITYPDDLDADLAYVGQVLRGEIASYTMEKRYIRRDGSLIWVALTVALVRDGNGQPAYFTSVIEDIEARKAAEAERDRLLAAEQTARIAAERAVQARDEFLSVAAHELKTPLTSLLGFSDALLHLTEQGRLDPASGSRALRNIALQSEKLNQLVCRLLDLARIELGQLVVARRPADLGRLAAEVAAAAQARTQQHRITVEASAAVRAEVDALRIEQALDNLLDNAIKFSPSGGPITVSVTGERPDLVRLAVRDQGLGVPEPYRAHIFERLAQAHADSYRSGLGLGLYLSRQIVEQHGGYIEATYPEQGGSIFSIVLPRGSRAEEC